MCENENLVLFLLSRFFAFHHNHLIFHFFHRILIFEIRLLDENKPALSIFLICLKKEKNRYVARRDERI